MYTNFAINNNTNSSHGRKNDTLKRLAKNVIEQSQKKERPIEGIIQENEYYTRDYIPAEIYICNISSKSCLNNNIEKSLNFLNRQAALKNLPHKDFESTEQVIEKNNELFDIKFDNSKNIFAA